MDIYDIWVDLKPGQRIRLTQANREGIVLKVEPDVKRADILVGDLKIKAGFDAIEQLPDAPPAATSEASGAGASGRFVFRVTVR